MPTVRAVSETARRTAHADGVMSRPTRRRPPITLAVTPGAREICERSVVILHHRQVDPGRRVEARVREVAATLGLHDFVYTVPIVATAKGTDEVGDGLLLANGTGAVLQVKSRAPEAEAGKATSWVRKHATKGYRQAVGSLKMIARRQREGAPLRAYPERVLHLASEEQELAALTLDHDTSRWPMIVVIDHPEADGLSAPNDDAMFVTLHDWRELNRAVRSTTGLIEYARRAIDAPIEPPLLGGEFQRFAAIVEADARLDRGGTHGWFNFDALDDPDGAQCYRELLERLWPLDEPVPEVGVKIYRRIVEHLDAVPPGIQVALGRKMLDVRRRLAEHGTWQSSVSVVDHKHLLVLAADRLSNHDGDISAFDAELAVLGAVRGHEVAEQAGMTVPVLAVGHLLDDQGISYRYIFQDPPADVPDDLRAVVERQRGRLDLAARGVIEVTD
jgi:hypothetical protein